MIQPVVFLDHETLATETPHDGAEGEGVAERPVPPPPPAPVLLDPSNKDLYTRGLRRLAKVPIAGFVGLNGQGKSFAAVRSCLSTLAEGRRVLSTVALLDPHTGNDHRLYTRLESWQQVMDFRDGILLLDEVTGIMDARDQGMPKHVRRHIAQFRRAGVQVRWTGIDWDNTDRRMRQLTQAVVRCRGHLPRRAEARVEMWAPNRLFQFTTYDAQTLKSSDDSAQFTDDTKKQRRARVLGREWVWGPGSLAFRCYNTLDSVSWVDNSCPICKGKPVERTCRGHDDVYGAPTSSRGSRASR